MRASRRLLLPVLAVGALGAWFLFSPRLPKDQTLEIVLGDSARDVTAVRFAYEDARTDWSSEVELNFTKGRAPRVVHHEGRLPDGDYALALDVTCAEATVHADRRVSLRGGTTSVDLSEVLRRSPVGRASR